MIITDDKYKEVEMFLISLKYTIPHLRDMLDRGIYWEKEFLIERAKEMKIPYMEEYLDNLNLIHPKGSIKFPNRDKIPVLDTKTGIVYESVSKARNHLDITVSTFMKYYKTGRLKRILEEEQ